MADYVKYTVRLNVSNSKHIRLIQVLNDLNKEVFPSKSRFILNALECYVDNMMSGSATNSGREREENQKKQFISREEYEQDMKNLKESVRRSLYEDMLKVMSSVILSQSSQGARVVFPAQETDGDRKTDGDRGEEDIDLTQYADIMKDIDAWSEN